MSEQSRERQAMRGDDFQAAAAAAELVRSKLVSLTTHHAQLTQDREALLQRTCALYAAPVRSDERKRFALAFIDAKGKGFARRAEWGQVLDLFSRPKGVRAVHRVQGGNVVDVELRHTGPLNMDDVVRTGAMRFDGVTGAPSYGVIADARFGFLGEGLDRSLLEAAIYFLLGDELKAKVSEFFDRQSQSEPTASPPDGKSIEDRLDEVRRNDERVVEIDTELNLLTQQIAELSIGKPPRDGGFGGYKLAEQLRGAQ